MDGIVSFLDIVTSYVNATLEALPGIAIGLSALALFWWLGGFARGAASALAARATSDTNLIKLAGSLTRTGFIVFGALVGSAIVFPGFGAGDIVGVLGLTSVAVGFAFKDVFQNFLAGILILARRPFLIGDQVRIGEVSGEVEEISFRNTAIRAFDAQLVLVPNAQLFTDVVTVVDEHSSRRSTLMTGVSYDADLREAKRVILRALTDCERVHAEPEPGVFVQAHGDHAVAMEVLFWHGSTVMEARVALDEVALRVKEALDDAGIGIPFPQRTLHLGGALESALAHPRLGGTARGAMSEVRMD